MFQHESFYFVGVLACIFVLWVVTGGPTHPISFAGPLLSGPGPLGGGTYLSLPHAANPIGGASIDESHASGGSLQGGSSSGSSSSPDFGTPSTYRGQVTLSHYLQNPGASDVRNEYLELHLSSNAKPIMITGWRVESEVSGSGAMIPLGTELPTSGLVSPIQPIYLKPGDSALIFSGISPIDGSFRENKCMGYFATYQTFVPQLPVICPAPKDELVSHYSDLVRDPTCRDYVESQVRRCQPVITPPSIVSSSCQNFVTTYLNYSGCVTTHQNDSDFKGDTWRIYLGRSGSMWRLNRETIRLVDVEGNTVDQFSY